MAAMCSVEETDRSAACKQIETLLDRALNADEANRVGDALSLYADAETRINRLKNQLRGSSDAKLIQRLNVYMTNIVSRKEALSERLDSALPAAPSAPPSYDSSLPPLPESPPAIERPAAPEGECLLALSHDGAQMYSVSAEGQVSVPSYPSRLSVQRLRDSGTPFLRLGDWSCPLLAGETPALLTGEGLNTLMLPDPASLRSGDSVAVMLPPDLSAAEKSAFLHLVASLTRLMVTDAASGLVREVRETDLSSQPQPQPQAQSPLWPQIQSSTSADDVSASGEVTRQRRTSDKVADGIKATSQVLARGLNWGADKSSALIQSGTNALRTRIEHSQGGPAPAQPASVNPRVSNGASVARTGTHAVVSTSVKAVGVVGRAAKSLATWAAPHVREGAARVLPASWMQSDENGQSKAQGALTVASAALVGLGTVYEALEHSAKLVGRATADGTAGVVGARYGGQAGRVTENVLYSVGNVGMTVHNVRQIGPKALIKTVATDTAKACAEQGQRRSSSHQ